MPASTEPQREWRPWSSVGDDIGAALTLFSERYPHVVYVHGNHEFYGSDRASVMAHTRAAVERLRTARNGAEVDGGRDFDAGTVQGDWMAEDDEFECIHVLNFQDKYVEIKEICELQDGTTAVVLHGGEYLATDTQITITKLMITSCNPPQYIRNAGYDFIGEDLRLIVPSGLRVYRPLDLKASGGNSKATFGCFDEDGSFEQRSLRQL